MCPRLPGRVRPEQGLRVVQLRGRRQNGIPIEGEHVFIATPHHRPLLRRGGTGGHRGEHIRRGRVAGESLGQTAREPLDLRPCLVFRRGEHQSVQHPRRGLRVTGAVEEGRGEALQRPGRVRGGRVALTGRGGARRARPPPVVMIRDHELTLRAGKCPGRGEPIEEHSALLRQGWPTREGQRAQVAGRLLDASLAQGHNGAAQPRDLRRRRRWIALQDLIKPLLRAREIVGLGGELRGLDQGEGRTRIRRELLRHLHPRI